MITYCKSGTNKMKTKKQVGLSILNGIIERTSICSVCDAKRGQHCVTLGGYHRTPHRKRFRRMLEEKIEIVVAKLKNKSTV